MDKQTILIIDDSPMNLKALAGILKEEYRILIAKSGEQALEIIVADKVPDLILLDVMMPGMDGYTLCTKIKEDDRTKSIPVIFITAKSGKDEIRKGLSLGAAAYIPKPFDCAVVKELVKTHLRQ